MSNMTTLEWSATEADNNEQDKESKSDTVIDELLNEFLNTKIELYKKLSEPQVKSHIKRAWFDQIANLDRHSHSVYHATP